MFYIIENLEKLDLLKRTLREEVYVQVIGKGFETHPFLDSPSLFYIRNLNTEEGFIIPVEHSETLDLPKDKVQEVLASIKKIYTLDRKYLLYFLNRNHIVDVNLLSSLTEYKTIEEVPHPRYQETLVRNNPDLENIGYLTPVSLLYQYCNETYNKCTKVIEKHRDFLEDPSWEYHNDLFTSILYLIERNGIGVDREKLQKGFTLNNLHRSVKDNKIYTHYNPYNTTSRPTNAFNGLNFLNIKKDSEERESFIPLNDYLMEVDFDGYHLRLLGSLVGFPFTEESVHLQMGRMYFGKQELTEEEYKASKQRSFAYLYGGGASDKDSNPFFDKVEEYADKIWEEFKKNKQVRVPGSNKLYTKKIGETNKRKLLNYFIQNIETTRNINVLKGFLKGFTKLESKVILYIYDGFILDIKESEREVVESLINKYLSQERKYPVKVNTGKNYRVL